MEEAVKRPYSSGREEVDEIKTSEEYYDGSKELNKITINCHIYEKEGECLHQNNCGWCGEKPMCISGNQVGPLEECLKETYNYAKK